jgi:hypothetical protein
MKSNNTDVLLWLRQGEDSGCEQRSFLERLLILDSEEMDKGKVKE